MKFPHRRQSLHLAAGAAALPAASRVARAQAYPTRPISMVVPLPAGGPTDVIGRVLTERMRTSLGQPVIVENVAGAAGNLGVGRIARASPDGYTIVVGFVGTHVFNGAMYPLQYDVLKDFTPISLIANIPYVLVAKKGFPANDLKTTRRQWRPVGWAPHSMSVLCYFRTSPEPTFNLYPIAGLHQRCRTWWEGRSM